MSSDPSSLHWYLYEGTSYDIEVSYHVGICNYKNHLLMCQVQKLPNLKIRLL